MPLIVTAKKKRDFDPKRFLATIGAGRRIVAVAKKQTVYAQGAACDAVFYIDKKATMLALHQEHTLSDMFTAYLLGRNIRYEEDLVDQRRGVSELWDSVCWYSAPKAHRLAKNPVVVQFEIHRVSAR